MDTTAPWKSNHKFLENILNSLGDHITVIDRQGNIHYVNNCWIEFGKSNSNDQHEEDTWLGSNYIETCEKSAELGDFLSQAALSGIKRILSGEQSNFFLEYPCHSPEEKRWFMMRATPFKIEDNEFIVISHTNITERKVAEEAIENQAKLDGLTNIFNRRYFNYFLEEEWSRCSRLNVQLSLILVDIDHFKKYNDTFGHLVGDKYLKKVAKILSGFSRRPSDMCARFGGEEFALIMGNTDHKNAYQIAERIMMAIQNAQMISPVKDNSSRLTVSLGMATITPDNKGHSEEIIKAADEMLYKAKNNGRNQIAAQEIQRNCK